ncbi:DNA ligase 1 [Euphorbia peplus]|nr:DNA ligase 1 [Euphorbia peplus]
MSLRKGEEEVPDKVTASKKRTKKRKGEDAIPSFDLLCQSLEAEEGTQNADGFDKAADIVDHCANKDNEKSCAGLDDSFEHPFGGEMNNIICDEQVDKDKDKSCGSEDVAAADVIPTPAVKDGDADKDKISSPAVEDDVTDAGIIMEKPPADLNPKDVVSWGKGEKVPFIFVCSALHSIRKEQGRILITNVVCNMLRTLMDTTPHDLLALVYLFTNKVAPAHEGVELGIGDGMIIKVLGDAFGGRVRCKSRRNMGQEEI